MRIFSFFIILIFASLHLMAQSHKADSLLRALKTSKEDTSKVNLLNQLGILTINSDEKKAFDYVMRSRELSEKLKWEKGKGNALNTIGVFYYLKQENENALRYLSDALKIKTDLKDIDGITKAYGNIGLVYMHMGNYPKAIEYYKQAIESAASYKNKALMANNLLNTGSAYMYQSNYPKALEFWFKSLKINEELNNKPNIASILGNIGLIYMQQSEFNKSLEYYQRALKINEEIENTGGIATCLGNIGLLYSEQGNIDKALEYYLKALKIDEEEVNQYGISRHYGNIGLIYMQKNEDKKAFEYFMKGINKSEELDDKNQLAFNYSDLAILFMKQKKYAEARKYIQKAEAICDTLSLMDLSRKVEQTFAELDSASGNYKGAFEHYKRFIAARDSIANEENIKKQTQLEMNYEFEKKEAASRLEQEKKDAIVKEEKQKQRIILFAVIGGLIIVITFSIFLYNRFRITSKQKVIIEKQKHEVDAKNEELNQQNEEISAQRDEIEQQKHLIEEHQKEILDSITYAKRIQEAILPPAELIKNKLPESFVLYKPKDIVAGDFYWMEQINDTILIAAADCTGHGVPGAMVSVVCANALNRAVKEFKLSETGDILDKVTDLVLETFEKSVNEVKDGMDISLLAINKSKRQIQWSGANNPLWYFYNGQHLEITADKQPVGKNDHRKAFTTHEIEYKSGTSFYLFTDGYADQFGGPKGKKFMYKKMLGLLTEVVNENPEMQKEKIESAFELWKGDLDQVDDVCVIGIRI